MSFFENIKIVVLLLLILLLSFLAIVLHRIGTIRKWEIEIERKEKRGNYDG